MSDLCRRTSEAVEHNFARFVDSVRHVVSPIVLFQPELFDLVMVRAEQLCLGKQMRLEGSPREDFLARVS